MTSRAIVPTPRLIALVAVWTTAAVLIVLLPSLWLVAGVALAALLLATVWDWWIVRAQPVLVRRELPERAHVGRSSEVTVVLSSAAGYPLRAEVLEQVFADLIDEPSFHKIDLRPGAEVFDGHNSAASA
jgi:uncharacterized protein (DUF58 family)